MYLLTPKFGSRRESPKSTSIKGKPKYSRSANRIATRLTSSPQEDGPDRQELDKENIVDPIGKISKGTEREDTLDFIEGKDLSPSYPKLGNFISFTSL
jgi:hypothetical protein